MNRIAERYRPHLQEIARLYVELGANKAGATRAARKIAGCEKLSEETLRAWMKKPEFVALVQVEEERAKSFQRTAPELRGLDKIAFYLDVDRTLREQFDGASEGDDEKAAHAVLAVIHRNSAEIRAEERHFEDMKQKQAQRDFGTFLRNVIRYVKVRHGAAHATLYPVLRDVLNNLALIQSGRFE